jgi:hypothetical protein
MHETSMGYLSLETLGCCITRTQGGKGYFIFTGFWDFCDHQQVLRWLSNHAYMGETQQSGDGWANLLLEC